MRHLSLGKEELCPKDGVGQWQRRWATSWGLRDLFQHPEEEPLEVGHAQCSDGCQAGGCSMMLGQQDRDPLEGRGGVRLGLYEAPWSHGGSSSSITVWTPGWTVLLSP